MPPGPAPKHPDQRVRRNATVPMVQLPAEGRKGRVPAWPIALHPVAELAEVELRAWGELWRLPQAVAWDRARCHAAVARYVRVRLLADSPKASAAVRKQAQDAEDRLGLNPVAMLRLRWEVVADEVAQQRDGRPTRRKLAAVDPTLAVGE